MAYLDDEPRYTSLIDLIDGGGAGKSGQSFEGGGLLSILANALMRPYGYEDRLRDRKNDTGRAVTTSVDELMRQKAAMRDMERQRGLLQNLQDPRNQDYASGFQDPMQGYLDMSMQPMEGVTTPVTNPFAVAAAMLSFLGSMMRPPFDVVLAPQEIPIGPPTEYHSSYLALMQTNRAIFPIAKIVIYMNLFFGGAAAWPVFFLKVFLIYMF